MKIHDENGTLLSIVVRNEDIKEGRNFLTDNSEEVKKNEKVIESYLGKSNLTKKEY